MTAFRAALATAASVAALVVAPAAAEPGDTFVLRGSTSGWVDVEVPGSGPAVYLHGARIETAGRFGGFFAEQLQSVHGERYVGASTGALVVRDLSVDHDNPALLGGAVQLTPGRIRFYLIADGPTTVTIQSRDDLPAATVRPKHRSATSYALVPLKRTGDAWARNTRVTLPRRAVAFVGMRAHGDVLLASNPEVCLANAAPDCSNDPLHDVVDRPGRASGAAAPVDESRVWWKVYWTGGPIFPGKRHARYAITPASGSLPVRQVRGASFVLTLA